MAGTTIPRGNVLMSLLIGVNLTPTAATTITTTAETFTVPGLLPNDAVQVAFSGTQTAGIGISNARVSAVDTLELTFINATAADATPAAGTYTVLISRPEYLPLPANAV